MIVGFLQNIAQKLNTLQIPYMLTGSAAMDFYSVGRSTKDIDIVIEIRIAHVEAFLAVFDNHYYHRPSIIEEIKRRGMFNIIDYDTGFKVDFIVRPETEYALMAFERRRCDSENFGLPIWVIAPEDLILGKIRWIQDLYSDRQIADIKQLLNNPTLDLNYIRYWVKTLELNIYQLAL
jgi:hypothetical protein